MGAKAGYDWLLRHQLPVAAVSGLMTASPLGAREAAQTVAAPVLGIDDLASPERIEQVFRPYIDARRPAPASPVTRRADDLDLPAEMHA